MEFLSMIMEITLGHDWAKFFDIVLANCRKPIFFSAEYPFFCYNKYNLNFKGQKIRSGTQMLSHAMCEKKFFLEGSGKLLTHYF
jgi:hypothetical protein